ncbi:hypothetical protein ACROYT_G010115 [Oculina patagonica]
MATDVLEYNDIHLLVRGALNDGRLKLHKGGVIFKANKTGKIDQAAVADIESTQWMRVARGFELNVALTNGSQFKFEGFKEGDYDQLAAFLKKHFQKDLEEIELSVKGWNWGVAKFKGSSLSFEVDEKPAFIVPLKDVSQATTGKNEVTLEFHQHDDAQICLMEMRFYIPATSDNTTEDPVKNFHEQVLQQADIIKETGDAIVTIPDVACLTPRGRYTMKVFPSFLQLHGKTYDYKIPYTSVLRLFLLPHKDQRFMFFVISMDPPIKQGQTRYPFLIIQFGKDEEFDVKLNLSEEELKEKYEGKITQEMDGPIYEIVSRLMKAVVGRRITVPGTFKSHSGLSCITCSYKAGSGMLYPLERGFIFVHKPPVHIRFDEISSVNFARVAGGGGSSRSFDFEVETKSGTTYVFSSIEKEEYGKLFDFVNGKHLRIKNTGKSKVSAKKYEDELMAGSDEDTHDAYLEQMKAEGAERDEDSASSDSDSDDEDFAPGSGAEDQDLKEEFESNPSSSESEEGSDAEEKPKHKEKEKKKEKKSPEKKRKASTSKSASPKKKAKISPEKAQGKRKKKAKKDADAPKRPMSAYMLWLGEIREQIKQENPGISVTEVSKVAGEKWKQIEDKSEWQEKAKQAKLVYEEQMKAYKERKANEPDDSPEAKPSKKGSVKEFFGKKGDKKKSSPRKSAGGESQKFKSAEFVDTDDSSSEDEGKKAKPKSKPKAKPEKKKSKKESDESDEEEESEEEDADISEGSDSD